MSIAYKMLKAAEKAGFNRFNIWCEGEELDTVDTSEKVWNWLNQVEHCEVHMHSPKYGNEWMLIIPDNGNEEDLSDFYAEGWVNNWFQENVR